MRLKSMKLSRAVNGRVLKVLENVLKYQVFRMLSVEGVTVAVDNAGLG